MADEKPVELEDELRPEYDTALLKELLKNGVRGKYVERYRQGTNPAKMTPDVAIPGDEEDDEQTAVEEALRELDAGQSRPFAEFAEEFSERFVARYGEHEPG